MPSVDTEEDVFPAAGPSWLRSNASVVVHTPTSMWSGLVPSSGSQDLIWSSSTSSSPSWCLTVVSDVSGASGSPYRGRDGLCSYALASTS